MRSSCNGCRVLRKGCGENCTIRPCLEWIKSPESQAQATLFLAKFYGRTGLLNLIHAGPDYLRPAVFKSLLYEACGRIVNPTHGSVGLLWSGEWAKCQAAVEAVLAGNPITVTKDGDASHHSVPPNSCDVRHLARDLSSSSADGKQPPKKNVVFKRASAKSNRVAAGKLRIGSVEDYSTKPRHEYQWNCPQRNLAPNCSGDHEESLFSDSAETGEASLAYRAELSRAKDSDFGLELTLGLP